MKTICLLLLSISVLFGMTDKTWGDASTRTWHSKRGDKLEATFIKVQNRKVVLQDATGKKMNIDLSSLSIADQNYVKDLIKTTKTKEDKVDVKIKAAPAGELPADFPWPRGKTTGPILTGEKSDDNEEWSYYLYLPKSFTLNKKWPVMFVMSPGGGKGGGALGRYIKGAEWNDWIVALSVQSKNSFRGSGDAILAMQKHLFKKLPIDADRVYASGFSGGARMLFWLAQEMKKQGIAGILPCGAGQSGKEISKKTIVYGLCGSNCFNRWDMACTHKRLKNKSNRLTFFIGNHEWANADLIADGITYLNLTTLKNVRPTDNAMCDSRDAICNKLLTATEEELETNPEHAYHWALYLSDYPAPPKCKRKATTMLDKLCKNPEIALYINALADVDKFTEKHFATNVMDYKNNNGTKSAANDGNKYAERYKDTKLAELFSRMGTKTP